MLKDTHDRLCVFLVRFDEAQYFTDFTDFTDSMAHIYLKGEPFNARALRPLDAAELRAVAGMLPAEPEAKPVREMEREQLRLRPAYDFLAVNKVKFTGLAQNLGQL